MVDLDALTKPIIDIYGQIELDLIEAIGRRFDGYDEISGSLEWQLKKLDEMGALNAEAVKIIAKYSKKTEKEIRKMLKSAQFANADLPALKRASAVGLIPIDVDKLIESPSYLSTLDDSFKELSATFKLINTHALESVTQTYMDVLNQTYVEVASGIYDYNTSIRRGVKRMADKGITAATYERKGQIVRYSIEAAVRRDTLTAVHQAANRNSYKLADDLGCEYVEVSSHANARTHKTNPIANHAGWQGKVYKIHGFDEKYSNLKNATGYPDDIQGLGGVNCRHRMFPFIPGVSVPFATQYDEKEVAKQYALSQMLRKKERNIRAIKKEIVALKAAGLPTKELKKKLNSAYDDIIDFCEKNHLERDFNREMIQGEK